MSSSARKETSITKIFALLLISYCTINNKYDGKKERKKRDYI